MLTVSDEDLKDLEDLIAKLKPAPWRGPVWTHLPNESKFVQSSREFVPRLIESLRESRKINRDIAQENTILRRERNKTEKEVVEWRIKVSKYAIEELNSKERIRERIYQTECEKAEEEVRKLKIALDSTKKEVRVLRTKISDLSIEKLNKWE
jgi:hypothetical protein